MKLVKIFMFVMTLSHTNSTDAKELSTKALRYQFKKLNYAVHITNNLYHDKMLYLPKEYKQLNNGFLLIEGYEFSENYIITALKHMCDENDFSPFLLIWEAFTRYKHLQETNSLKEFALAIICVLKSTVRHHSPNVYSEWIAHEAIKTNSITLAQAVEILDVLIHELPPLFDQYEITSNISWQSWGRKYWLMFPVALGALLIKTYLNTVR